MSEFALSINNTSRDLEVQKYPPILTAEQEYDLAIELYENGSLSAAKKLVLAHMRFVAFIAHGYKGYGLENADLIQEGTIGLMKAVKRFNPHKKVRLSSFAVYWIRAEIHEYIFKNWKIVKVATTKAQRKLFFKLRKAKSNIFQSLTSEQAQVIANDLGVRKKDVIEMESRLELSDVAFEVHDDDDSYMPEQYISDPGATPEQLALNDNHQEDQHNKLYQALSSLDERSIDILQSRYLKDEKSTLHTLADKYGVSAERVRQLENKAIKKLKERLEG
ncbi:MAG: RNA polymerase sigma factor RpoH [Candidatus Thioglobus sp.]|jgi:RNA polymerase sigma-32 factor|nr:RNA polymerase sigma factor RpoH [Candidatus Thioglobus sp.]